jgi:hypothetical protein
VRIPLPLLRKLNAHIKKTGMSQTDVVISALSDYLNVEEDQMTLTQKMAALEERVAALEAKGY